MSPRRRMRAPKTEPVADGNDRASGVLNTLALRSCGPCRATPCRRRPSSLELRNGILSAYSWINTRRNLADSPPGSDGLLSLLLFDWRPVVRRFGASLIVPLHPPLRTPQFAESELLVEAVSVLGSENPPPEALKLRMRNDHF